MAKVTSKGQVTLPKAVRDALGLKPGEEVEFVIENSHVVLRRRVDFARIERWIGCLQDSFPADSVDALMTELRGEPLAPVRTPE